MIIVLFLCLLIELQKCNKEINHENRSVDNPHTAILYGNSTLGENMTKHSVIVDTGSQTTTIKCDQCHQCGQHENPPYQFNENNYNSTDLRIDFNCSSFQNNRCNFASYYVEGSSIGGFYFKDKVLIGDGLIQLDDQYVKQESFESILGCTQFETGQLYNQLADGIFGLAPISNYSQFPPNLIDFIAKKDKAFSIKRGFSICLNDDYGYISVGGYDQLRLDPDFKINKIKFKPSQQYQVNLTKIAFGDQIFTIDDSINTQGQGIFIDSGATISYMDHKIYNQLVQGIKDHFEINQIPIKSFIQQQICFEFIQNDSNSDYYQYFPTMKFVFDDDIEIHWKPQEYLNIQNKQVCIGVDKLSDRVILGQNWMRKKDILFDLDQQEISVVTANCTLDYFKLQVINTSDNQTDKQNQQVVKNIRLPSVLKSNIKEREDENKDQDNEIVNKVNEIISKQDVGKNEEDEHSWLEIFFYIFIVVITLKGLIFLGLYIMKRLGGNLYTYQQKHERFQKLNNQIHIDDEEERDSTEHKIELVIQQSDIIA
ncbi:unnamed protein product [Paramecium pentaurelia]|uniref:Peptidase A1 domain-containing protein n=1 Tax=Paramecium pentaurelia TaxID=43138 RepID=A0A8S1RZ84_9CILI|nr:unnamed protein product [Paramecium pentaurelia]